MQQHIQVRGHHSERWLNEAILNKSLYRLERRQEERGAGVAEASASLGESAERLPHERSRPERFSRGRPPLSDRPSFSASRAGTPRTSNVWQGGSPRNSNPHDVHGRIMQSSDIGKGFECCLILLAALFCVWFFLWLLPDGLTSTDGQDSIAATHADLLDLGSATPSWESSFVNTPMAELSLPSHRMDHDLPDISADTILGNLHKGAQQSDSASRDLAGNSDPFDTDNPSIIVGILGILLIAVFLCPPAYRFCLSRIRVQATHVAPAPNDNGSLLSNSPSSRVDDTQTADSIAGGPYTLPFSSPGPAARHVTSQSPVRATAAQSSPVLEPLPSTSGVNTLLAPTSQGILPPHGMVSEPATLQGLGASQSEGPVSLTPPRPPEEAAQGRPALSSVVGAFDDLPVEAPADTSSVPPTLPDTLGGPAQNDISMVLGDSPGQGASQSERPVSLIPPRQPEVVDDSVGGNMPVAPEASQSSRMGPAPMHPGAQGIAAASLKRPLCAFLPDGKRRKCDLGCTTSSVYLPGTKVPRYKKSPSDPSVWLCQKHYLKTKYPTR